MKRLLVLVLLIPLVAACGPKTKPTLIKVDESIYLSVKALHETAVVLGKSGVLTPAQELQIQEAILPITILGEQATRVIVAWKSGPTPPELTNLILQLRKLTEKVIEIIPMQSTARAALLEKVALVQQAIVTILLITRGAA